MKTLSHGFSLIELITTVSISTILLSIGAPSLSDFNTRFRADSNIKVIQQTLMLARNHAISFNRKVTVCALSNNQCISNWQLGLTVFIDVNSNSQLDSNETTIFTTNAFNTRDTVIYNRTLIRFQPDGLASGTNGTLKYCPSSPTSPYSRGIVVNQAGRARLSTDAKIRCG
ncbi:GspH/FimT family pseudopilin [Shewanella sp. FJAT-51649]|uniref:GspH/FimT family pseudopilin n=1 Tax=Shewanella sp. FJAT-51649 TaxID=2864210 RepID=UPI001C657665|nr:GspH/FimT family pseudopilin [Shewanella sp. FJAT-51649]QYJ70477.1 GspH/FimT family pseudopilin [Shewanella sp. FJAT-51649]